jgi:hypothetical protein
VVAMLENISSLPELPLDRADDSGRLASELLITWIIISALFYFAFFPTSSYADTLSGTVVDAYQNPKSAVLIDILGPVSTFTQTDEQGQFSVDVPSGHYIVRIRDDRHRAEIEVYVDREFNKTFRLNW